MAIIYKSDIKQTCTTLKKRKWMKWLHCNQLLLALLFPSFIITTTWTHLRTRFGAAHLLLLLVVLGCVATGSAWSVWGYSWVSAFKLDLTASQCALQVIIGCLLQQLGVLQSLYEFEFLSFHAFDHSLMLDALVFLPEHLVFDLLLRTHLSLHELTLSLVLGLHLLPLYHLLQTVILDLLLMLLHLHEVLLVTLLLLDIVHVSPDLLLEVPLGRIDICPHDVLLTAVLRLSEGLLLVLNSLSLCTLSCHFQVALARTEDVVGALLGLVELFPCLYTQKSNIAKRVVLVVPFVLLVWVGQCG